MSNSAASHADEKVPLDLGPVAIVDDDATTRLVMRQWLRSAGHDVIEFASGSAALAALPAGASVVCLDLGLEDMPGIHVLQHLLARDPDLPIVVVTAELELETAVACMRAGACDYLAKPLDRTKLVESVRRAVERQAAAAATRRSHTKVADDAVTGSLVGRSPPMLALRRHIERVLDSEVTVCVFGESGTGKELVANAIHEGGRRRRGPFVAINCAAIPQALQESELFGHERGAFTGATGVHRGRFEQANNGTLFLDELGEMSPSTQASLLRTLQQKSIRRIGGTTEIPINVRIVCATHRDLEHEVSEGRFREDLFFRLVVYPVRVPPLRERCEDIPLLVGHFLEKLRADTNSTVRSVSADALSALALHPWPGNVRELQNVIHRGVLAADGDQLHLVHLSREIRERVLPSLSGVGTAANGPPSRRMDAPSTARGAQLADLRAEGDDVVVPLEELERRAVIQALRAAGGSVGKAARMLGMGRATLYRRLAAFELKPSQVE
jgi:DNA-binding NtrC family response regulator